MTAQNAVLPISAGATATELSCLAPGTDTIPDACVLLVRNTGAGAHVLTIGAAGLSFDGLSAGTAGAGSAIRTINFTAGQIQTVRVPGSYGDANNRCNIGADGTPSEVKYTVISA